MKIITLVFCVLLFLYGIFGVLPKMRRNAEHVRAFSTLSRLPFEDAHAAVESFIRDRKATNGVVPRTVSFRDLMGSGYLQVTNPQPFEEAQVVFPTDFNPEHVQAIFAEVRLSDGFIAGFSGDGSIQLLSPTQYLRTMAQQNNLSEPLRPATNPPPAATGSGH